MSRLSKAVLVVAVIMGLALTTSSLSQAASIRPISDFLSTQGTFDLGVLFEPPVPNYGGWSDLKGHFALVDYAGVANNWLIGQGGTSLGTSFSGTIIENPLPDGRAEVSVSLHTKKALTFVANGFNFGAEELLFGFRAQDVLAGAPASLADCFLQLKFINTAPGAPLPDLIQLIFAPTAEQQLQVMSFRADASGTLRAAFGVPDGTPGRATVIQTGLLEVAGKASPHSRVARDAFPAELINLMVVGK